MSDRFLMNEVIQPGSERWSNGREYHVAFQADGNLVLYHHVDQYEFVVWDSKTGSIGGVPVYRTLILQSDGNFVMYDASKKPLWSTDTYNYGAKAPFVQIKEDGNFCLLDPEVRDGFIWQTGRVA